ncbi:MAG: DUF2116 family Zn-ribbon domain-containing protein [Bacteroidales bacterium]|jgi:predicted nucleic acid-binding Zn ribbon protein|nr:DUF2116 family Zn-ribbon domain-containing protein [Bacteroidales bacterium]
MEELKIRCSNCGKMIPYAGNVCPYCNADKQQDKSKQGKMFLIIMAVFILLIIYIIS